MSDQIDAATVQAGDQPDGLLSAFVLDGNGGGRALDWNGIRHWNTADGVLWVHLDRTGTLARQWVIDHELIDRVSAETLLRREGNRPRVVRVGDALVVALRGINRMEGGSADDMPAMHMWINANLIVTLRRRRLAAGQQLAADVAAGNGPCNASEFLVAMTQHLVEPIIPMVAELNDSIDQLQQEVLAQRGERLRTRLQLARQETINFRRHVAPQRDALIRLQAEQVRWLDPMDRAYLREIADYTARYVEDLDAARERAGVAQDELNNQLAERMNRTMYLLTIVSALLLPPALITGLFGINVGGMPGVEDDHAFYYIAASIPVLGVIEFWALRRLGWI